MVSTRHKVYQSPPDISQSPKTTVRRKSNVKKLIKKLPNEELNLDCSQHQKKTCNVFPTKKKHDVEDNSGEMLFVIDKRPSRTTNSSNSTSGIIDSDEEVNKCDGGNDASPKLPSDENFESELLNISINSQNGEPPEEIYEIDMSNIKTATDDSLNLRLEDTDEDSSGDSMDLDNENEDHFDDKNICELPKASQTRTANNSTMNNITNNLENCNVETEQFDSQFFVIDKGPSSSKSVVEDSQLYITDRGTSEKNVEMQGYDESNSEESESDDEPTPVSKGYNLASRIQSTINLGDRSYVNLKPLSKKPLPNTTITSMKNEQVEQLMKKSILKPGFEKQHFVEPITSKRQQKRDRRAERAKTKGAKWYDMAAPEMTPELKNDLSVLQMRRAIDPKRFYKNNDMPGLPKYFQMGRVVESAADFYHGRVPKKQRKANIVEELLADAEFIKYNKKKYTEIQEKKIQRSRGAYKHMKRLKKKK